MENNEIQVLNKRKEDRNVRNIWIQIEILWLNPKIYRSRRFEGNSDNVLYFTYKKSNILAVKVQCTTSHPKKVEDRGHYVFGMS